VPSPDPKNEKPRSRRARTRRVHDHPAEGAGRPWVYAVSKPAELRLCTVLDERSSPEQESRAHKKPRRDRRSSPRRRPCDDSGFAPREQSGVSRPRPRARRSNRAGSCAPVFRVLVAPSRSAPARPARLGGAAVDRVSTHVIPVPVAPISRPAVVCRFRSGWKRMCRIMPGPWTASQRAVLVFPLVGFEVLVPVPPGRREERAPSLPVLSPLPPRLCPQ